MSECIIIGAGPAGLAAAIAAAKQGVSVRVIDEFVKPGGRLLGQLHQEPDGEWWNGIEEAEKLVAEAKAAGVSLSLGTSVYDLQKTLDGWRVSTTDGILDAPAVLLATGAAETAVPLPGWTLPGVMSIGAAQVMTNVQRVRVGARGVIIGVNILSVAITRELQLAGIHVDRMVLPPVNDVNKHPADPAHVMQSLLRVAHLAPSPLIRLGSRLMQSAGMQRLGVRFFPPQGVKMWGIPIQLRTAALEIIGSNQVEGVRIARIAPNGTPVPGSDRIIPADFVCIAGGLYPLAELAAVAGCPFAYIPELGGHVPLHDEQMRTPLDGLYAAGNITGIESAKVAKAQGYAAGLSIANTHGPNAGTLEDELARAIRQVEQVRAQATIQFHPYIQEGRRRIASLYAAHVQQASAMA
ncbi:NAD(P)/FAD-dependent oxidoreductase [Brevibacillus fluminis]|uniref:NAD(P)/FAD-dependent oxidoreductase n=1 Tax=Brevibacillus fluminis TaxID=511487 RepID=UPI003F8B6D0D